MRFGNRLLIGLEEKLGRLAFPGILRWIAGFQLLGLILSVISPGFSTMTSFDKDAIFSGQVWRLVSWLCLPEVRLVTATDVTASIFFTLITTLFLFFLNDAIEESVGTFRLNIYVFVTWFLITLAALSPLTNPVFVTLQMRLVFFSAMVLAAAVFFPNQIIHLMMVIPIKMKWIAWIDVAFLVSRVFLNSLPLINSILVVFGLLAFLIGVLPLVLSDLKNTATASARRARFHRDSGHGEENAFHTCHQCGITDLDDPNLEFRIAADDGEEYCLPCREKNKAAT